MRTEAAPEVEGADFRVTVKVRNARLLRAIERAGFSSVPKFAAAIGQSPTIVYEYVGLVRAPIDKRGEVRPDIMRIGLALGASIEDLFPPAYMTRVLARNAVTIEMTEAQIGGLISEARSPDADLLSAEAEGSIGAALATLPPADRRVIEMRFGLNGEREHTLQELADMDQVTRTAIQRRELQALRRLRSPKRIEMARDAWGSLELGAMPEAPGWREPEQKP